MARRLTIHAVVRNEPLIYYSIKSVYDFADVILLYDTGSYDAHTLEYIEVLLAEDHAKKIVFKHVPIETDETRWTKKNWQSEQAKNAGKRGVGWVRLVQMEDTTTAFFMILDGDEVHYRESMQQIRRFLPRWPKGKACGFVPSVWYCDRNHIFRSTPHWGRLFKTGTVGMMTDSPGEMHTWEGQAISFKMPCSFQVPNLIPYAHFETMVRPWRRNVKHKQKAPRPLPEVMLESPKYLERFVRERKS